MKTGIASPSNLSGKVVVVTGGAGLLGKTFCRAIAASGGIAVVADIDADRVEAAADDFGLMAAMQKERCWTLRPRLR